MPRCQCCGENRVTQHCQFRSNVSFLVRRQESKISADMCLSCATKNFFGYQIPTLCFTWFGIIGAIVGPFFILINFLEYGTALFLFGRSHFQKSAVGNVKPPQARQSTMDDQRSESAEPLIEIMEKLLSLQLSWDGKSPREAFSTLATKKLAAGYVFGFQNAAFQIFKVIKPDDDAGGIALLMKSYKQIFGEPTGLMLLKFSLDWQREREFVTGRLSGAEEIAEFKSIGTPPLGLQRIITLGFDASMVERTLKGTPSPPQPA